MGKADEVQNQEEPYEIMRLQNQQLPRLKTSHSVPSALRAAMPFYQQRCGSANHVFLRGHQDAAKKHASKRCVRPGASFALLMWHRCAPCRSSSQKTS
eukprot:212745-Chlamydomonas_euryale.AAC.2